MFRAISVIVLLAVGAAIYAWYSAQALPSWFADEEQHEKRLANDLNQLIRQQGAITFLGDKFSDVINGTVVFSEPEFNAVLLTSLKAHKGGQKLLAVSDAVKAIIHDNEIEISAVINLDKVEKVNAKARKAVEKVNRVFPFLNNSRVAVSVFGTPVARDGKLGIRDDFTAKVGSISLSNDSLRQLGADVERANQENLTIKYLSIKSVSLAKGQITLGVAPRL